MSVIIEEYCGPFTNTTLDGLIFRRMDPRIFANAMEALQLVAFLCGGRLESIMADGRHHAIAKLGGIGEALTNGENVLLLKMPLKALGAP